MHSPRLEMARAAEPGARDVTGVSRLAEVDFHLPLRHLLMRARHYAPMTMLFARRFDYLAPSGGRFRCFGH